MKKFISIVLLAFVSATPVYAQPFDWSALAGAAVGGFLGNQVGGGNGKTIATAAGAIAGYHYVANRNQQAVQTASAVYPQIERAPQVAQAQPQYQQYQQQPHVVAVEKTETGEMTGRCQYSNGEVAQCPTSAQPMSAQGVTQQQVPVQAAVNPQGYSCEQMADSRGLSLGVPGRAEYVRGCQNSRDQLASERLQRARELGRMDGRNM